MNVPGDLLYTREHEWIKIEGDIGTVGITDYAQHALGDITFVELPKINSETAQGKLFATIESVKAASDIFAPISGEVTEINSDLETNPALVNESCYLNGWIAKIKIKDFSEKENLMKGIDYKKFLEETQH